LVVVSGPLIGSPGARPVRVRSEVILVALGGALSAGARYELLQTFPVHRGRFPLTTGSINVGGAFLLGFLLEWLTRHRDLDHWARWLVGVGGLGAFTTSSSPVPSVRPPGTCSSGRCDGPVRCSRGARSS
jgi:drug/metabolite transporter (DMT)-like permease